MDQHNDYEVKPRHLVAIAAGVLGCIFGEYLTIQNLNLRRELASTQYDRDHWEQIWHDVRETPLRVEAYDMNGDGLDDMIINSPAGFTQHFTASMASGEQHIQYTFNVPDTRGYRWVPYRPTTPSP